MLQRRVDTIVLGCTHYPFAIPMIEKIAGSSVRVIDPAPAVAAQVGRLLAAREMCSPLPGPAMVRYLTTGEREAFEALLPKLLGETGRVDTLHWEEHSLH
jgi:glutamate racemase